MKQTKAHETRCKQPQNGTRLSPNLAQRNKRNRTREKHKNGKHLQRKNSLALLENKASKKVNTLNMF
jgi:hypothetical protein